MRLLKRRPDGEFSLTEYNDRDTPAYAILSHTWAEDNSEEVSFQDVDGRTGKSKAGWKKIEFCADKADADGLQYFWIDTCCIDKRSSAELSKAINSMFRWYRKASRCYVYLTDVSAHDGKETARQCRYDWEAAFRESRWFTRGWTLQELLAPSLVDFFNLEGERLGNKRLLEDVIQDITGIAKEALRGEPLAGFTRDERMSWALGRHCTEEEDHAYSLLGIFDVSMPLIYGEGKEKAYQRLQEEIEKSDGGPASDPFVVGFDPFPMPEPTQFVSRENELTEMHRFLHGHKSRSIVVLYGLGGIGKTQLAMEFVRRHKEKHTATFWLNANDEDSLKLSFRTIAQQVLEDHPSTSTLANVDLNNLNQVVDAVKTWLKIKNNTRWLMIYDNYDNPQASSNLDRSAVDIGGFLPRADHGSIIITTRSAQVTKGQRIHVQKLADIQEGLEILSKMSKRGNIGNALVKELDGLPLALSTAGAYLENVSTSFSDYLRLYKSCWLKLQMTSPQVNSYENRSLHSTWQITFDRIERQNAASAKLLKLWAYFDRQDVWFELLRHASSSEDESIQKLTEDKLSFNEAAMLLCSFGLVDPDRPLQQLSGSVGYSIHSCVHSWTKFVLNRAWDRNLAMLALKCVASEVPDKNVDRWWWVVERRLLQHAAKCEDLAVDSRVNVQGMEWALHSLGNLYADQDKFAGAESMYERALQSYEKALGSKHTATLDTIHRLGLLYKDQGRLAEAE
ncbi:HET-domain-containing protein, partial [Lepidopterella palustris CBS 459.81]